MIRSDEPELDSKRSKLQSKHSLVDAKEVGGGSKAFSGNT